ncbi:MAG TPA: pseudouridine synthase [Sedimentisphaerales bacterium]|nr:pseudouridine synthase [Sedimentisphaerales bacterium]
MAEQRLQKVLAAAGVASRRRCEELIVEGAVRVNRQIVDELPAFVDPDNDIITVNGKKIHPVTKEYYLLNKPKGVICTNSDPQGRKKAIDIVYSKNRIFCVGRLDMDTSGLIILTNDSELTNKLTHPRYELSKTYVAHVDGEITGEEVEKLKKGIWLAEGKTNNAAIKVLKRNYKESLVQITIRQGINRQIRRMLARIGLNVKSLKRLKIGKLTDKGIGIGQYRKLTTAEIKYLEKATSEINQTED